MKTKSKIWIKGYFIIVLGVLSAIGALVVRVDPFFHYHKPDTERYYYPLDNQRSMNDGIARHFEYDALITGTSMAENFRTTEMDAIFGVHAIKIPFAGGPYEEINESVGRALDYNPGLMTVIRCMDMAYFFDPKDRKTPSEPPAYLYDNNIVNDVKYIFNRDVIFDRVYPMVRANKDETAPGMESFDDSSNWMVIYSFGRNSVLEDEIVLAEEDTHITEEERAIIHGNIEQNITSLPERYPDVTFYYFFSPYSAAWWETKVTDGTIYKQIEAEECIIEQILEYDNIKLFSFNNRTDVTTDLNNYKDEIHYGEWINSLMLKWMHDDQYLLTKENYKDYLSQELSFYTSYDYSLLREQEDYKNDYFAEALLREEFAGVEPLELLPESSDTYEQDNSEMEVIVEEIGPYKYLFFDSKVNADQEQAGAWIYNESNEEAAALTVNSHVEHQYMIDVSRLEGKARIVFSGADFWNITLY